MMRALVLSQPGPSGRLALCELPRPRPGPGELLVKVRYAGLNRADLFQLQGRYPAPEASVPGLELAGRVVACGEGVAGWEEGDEAFGIVEEGAFAEYALLPATRAFAVPEGMALEKAAALPEALCTAWVSLVWQAKLQKGETLLVHGGASGVGHIALQLGKLLGAQVFATAGTLEKCEACLRLGADGVILHTQEDFVAELAGETQGRGVDVILDMVGGDYIERNLKALAVGGRLCIIAFLKGAKREVNLSPVLLKRLSVMGSTLRSRPAAEKAQITAEIQARLGLGLVRRKIKPLIDSVFALEEAEKALLRMEQGLNIGKILLKL